MAQEEIASATLEKLRGVSTATLATQLFKRGFRQQFLVGVHPLNAQVTSFAGDAFTMRFIPAREDKETHESTRARGDANLQWEGIERVGAGQVLMIDSRNDISAASAGNILMTRLMRRGAVAAVTDGAWRDGPEIAAMPFPAYARASTASTRLTSFHVADLQVPIGCAGVAVYPGDIVVGDREGVIVVPRHVAHEIADDSAAQEELELYLQGRIEAGEALWGVYPPDEKTLAAYRAQRKGRE